jgi:hypothetical protein
MERSPPGGVQEVIGFPPRGIILHIFKVAVWRLFYFTMFIYSGWSAPRPAGCKRSSVSRHAGLSSTFFKVAVWRLFYFTGIYRDGALPAARGARGHRFPAS